jgi:hypothetical protein
LAASVPADVATPSDVAAWSPILESRLRCLATEDDADRRTLEASTLLGSSAPPAGAIRWTRNQLTRSDPNQAL